MGHYSQSFGVLVKSGANSDWLPLQISTTHPNFPGAATRSTHPIVFSSTDRCGIMLTHSGERSLLCFRCYSSAALQPIVPPTHPPATQREQSVLVPILPLLAYLAPIKGRPIPPCTKHCPQPPNSDTASNMPNCQRPLIGQSMTFHHWPE